jgi:hypothetical protein
MIPATLAFLLRASRNISFKQVAVHAEFALVRSTCERQVVVGG